MFRLLISRIRKRLMIPFRTVLFPQGRNYYMLWSNTFLFLYYIILLSQCCAWDIREKISISYLWVWKESGSFLVLKALKTVYNVSKMAGRIKQKALNIMICNHDYCSLHSWRWTYSRIRKGCLHHKVIATDKVINEETPGRIAREFFIDYWFSSENQ